MERINVTVYYMVRTALTTPTNIKNLSRTQKSTKRATMATTTTSARTRKRVTTQINKKFTLLSSIQKTMKNNANEELNNFENLSVSDEESK